MIRTSRAGVILAVVVAGAFLLGGVAVPLTNHPKFCATCHVIAPSYETWRVSTHKDVTCVACHVRPGIDGWLHDKAWNGTKDLLITWFGTPSDPSNLDADVVSDVCLSCHQAVLRVSEVATRDLPEPVKRVGLIMSHRKHMEAFAERGKGEGCTACHSRVVHGTPIKGYPIVIPRGHVEEDEDPHYPEYPETSTLWNKTIQDCFRCHDGRTEHNGKVLSKKCEICHLPDKIGSFLFD